MMTLKEMSYMHTLDCLIKNGWHRGNTSKELDISDRGLRIKLDEMRQHEYFKEFVPAKDFRGFSLQEATDNYFVAGIPSNKERLAHADNIINRNWL